VIENDSQKEKKKRHWLIRYYVWLFKFTIKVTFPLLGVVYIFWAADILFTDPADPELIKLLKGKPKWEMISSLLLASTFLLSTWYLCIRVIAPKLRKKKDAKDVPVE
jgi:hypothetical protein